MAQITIYLPDDLEKKARKTAKAQGKSVSRWIASQIENSLEDRWPKAVIDAAGAIPDFPDVEELRKGYGSDAPRESLD
jgi:predicted transcriptional regulator